VEVQYDAIKDEPGKPYESKMMRTALASWTWLAARGQGERSDQQKGTPTPSQEALSPRRESHHKKLRMGFKSHVS